MKILQGLIIFLSAAIVVMVILSAGQGHLGGGQSPSVDVKAARPTQVDEGAAESFQGDQSPVAWVTPRISSTPTPTPTPTKTPLPSRVVVRVTSRTEGIPQVPGGKDAGVIGRTLRGGEQFCTDIVGIVSDGVYDWAPLYLDCSSDQLLLWADYRRLARVGGQPLPPAPKLEVGPDWGELLPWLSVPAFLLVWVVLFSQVPLQRRWLVVFFALWGLSWFLTPVVMGDSTVASFWLTFFFVFLAPGFLWLISMQMWRFAKQIVDARAAERDAIAKAADQKRKELEAETEIAMEGKMTPRSSRTGRGGLLMKVSGEKIRWSRQGDWPAAED